MTRPIFAYDHRDATDKDVAVTVLDLDNDECRDKLVLAIRILRMYPKGQSNGDWIKHRQWFLENFLPEEDCK